MSAETLIKTTLDSTPSVTTLVGTRIYIDYRPQDDALPAVVYRRDSTVYVPTISSAVALTRVTLSVLAYALTRSAAEFLGDTVEAALRGAKFLIQDRSAAYDAELAVHVVVFVVESLS